MHSFKAIGITLIIMAAVATFACKEKAAQVDELGRANASPQMARPAEMPGPMVAENDGTTVSTGKTHEGVILETTDVKDYTYIHFRDREGLEHWAAVIKGKYDNGKNVRIVESIVMKNFTSPTLNKTFESIIFGNVTNTDGAGTSPENSTAQQGMPSGHPPVKSDSAASSPNLPDGHPPIK
ncbi:MAG: hypothetical protein JXX14_26370 [Deltaproteobacteria bacterium]|nr:hypothetical protein [Deltaproteobacteria bacterium]